MISSVLLIKLNELKVIYKMKVNPKSNAIKVNKVLPKSVCISSAGTHLYSIGLSLYKPLNARKDHSLIYRPILVFILLIVCLLRQLLLIIIPEQSQEFYTMVGDITYFMVLRIPIIYCNYMCCTIICTVLTTTQLL